MTKSAGIDGLRGARPFPGGDMVRVNYLFINEIAGARTAGLFYLTLVGPSYSRGVLKI